MAGPGGVDTGLKARVTVVPDTSKFVPSLEKYIKRIEHSLRIELPTSLDTTGATADFEGLKAKLQANNVKIQASVESIQDQVVAEVETATRTAPRVHVGVDVDRSVAKRVAAMTASFAKLVSPFAAVVSVAAAAAPFIIKAGRAVVDFGRAAVAASPALLAFAAAGGIVLLSLKAITPALGKSLQPIADSFSKMGKKAADAATKGVRPLAKALADAAFPKIEPAITRIGVATNKVVKAFLDWAKSTAGLRALKQITDATAAAFEKIAPAAERFTESLGAMLGRIASVSLGAGSSGLAGLLDRLGRAMDGVNAQSVAAGLKTLGQDAEAAWRGIKKVYDVVAVSIALYEKYRTQINLISDAAAILAIAFGGPVTAVVAAVGLLVRHFNDIKKAITGVKNAAAGGSNLGKFFSSVATLGSQLWSVLKSLWQVAKDQLGPALSGLGKALRGDLLPQLTNLVQVLGPQLVFAVRLAGGIIVAFAALVIHQLTNLVTVASGAMEALIGVFERNPGKVKEGLATVFRGSKQFVTDQASDLGNLASAAFGQGLTDAQDAANRAARALVSGTAASMAQQAETHRENYRASGILVGSSYSRGVGDTKSRADARSAAASLSAASVRGLAVGDTKQTFSRSGTQMSGGLAKGISGGKSGVKTAAATLPTSATAGVGNTFNLLRPAGSRAGLGFASAVASKRPAAKTAGSGLTSSASSGARSGNAGMKGAGQNAGQGFISGILSMGAAVSRAAQSLGQRAVAAVKSTLHIASPSKVMIALGRFVTQGFAEGILKDAGKIREATTKLTQKINDAWRAFQTSRNAIAERIDKDRVAIDRARKAYADAIDNHGKGAAAAAGRAKQRLHDALKKLADDKRDQSVLKKSTGPLANFTSTQIKLFDNFIKGTGLRLELLAKQREKIAVRLADAKQKLQDAIGIRDDYARSVADATRAFASIITDPAEGKALTATDVVKNLQAKLAAIQKFRTNLEALKSAGLSDAALKQLVDAGVEAGSATADALAKGGQEAINQVNDLTASIGSQADILGQSSAAQFFQAGVDAAQGLVDGLQSQMSDLNAQMEKIADALVATLKKKLKIKSPSQVMADLGVFVGRGFAAGMDASRTLVDRASSRMASAATPVPAGFGGGGVAALAGSGGVNVTVYNPTPETASESTTRIMRRLAVLGPA